MTNEIKKSIEFLKQTKHKGIKELFDYIDFVFGKALEPCSQEELITNNEDLELLQRELTEIKKLTDRVKLSLSKKIVSNKNTNDKIF